MQELKEKQIQKIIKHSAYVAILNKLKNKNKITDNEYEKIRNKIEKKS